MDYFIFGHQKNEKRQSKQKNRQYFLRNHKQRSIKIYLTFSVKSSTTGAIVSNILNKVNYYDLFLIV